MPAVNVAAIVLAAGLSGRMGKFKPLLPLGGVTVLERCATLFRDAGVNDVRVVTGYRRGELEPLLASLGVRGIANLRYLEGMFSSVLAGLDTIGSEVGAFFVLPVDIPLVRAATIRRLIQAYGRERGADVIYPCFRGERGHPPLIAGGLAEGIRRWKGGEGLKGALAEREQTALDVAVADENILLDLDTPDDWRLMEEKAGRSEVPTAEECGELLAGVFGVGEDIIRHGEAVARVATRLGEELNRVGCCLDIQLLEAAGLLHDIAKGEADHAAAGARILREHGFAAAAEAVATHMDITVSRENGIGAGEVIYLADKMVRGERPVSLEERFRSKLERHADDPAVFTVVKERLKRALEIRNRIEARMGRTLDEIISQED